ncbi:MAG: peptidylprolyl isomerase [Acidimicrobiales bacterium]
MPTDKRARQRAGRQARLEATARRQRRRRRIRSSIIGVLIAAIVVFSVYEITRKSPTSKTNQTLPNTAQGKLEAIWEKAGCPAQITTAANLKRFKKPTQTVSTLVNYDATVKTDVGSFVIRLDPKTAPIAVNSFVFLAQHKFYDCNMFHRVIQGFVDQTGDPTGTGRGDPGYKFTEAGPATATPQYPLGSVALANSDNPASTRPTTNGSQWFVVDGPAGESLPPDYVLFGTVASGMSVVDKINKDGASSTGAATGTPKVFHRILSVKIKETPAS